MNDSIFIKNMVCPRCISAIEVLFNSLNIKIISVTLGEVVTVDKLTDVKKKELEKIFLENGFELLIENSDKTVAQIKAIIIEEIHHNNGREKINISKLLCSKINKEYSSITKLFSDVEKKTITQFVQHQKIEKVKELLVYNELTLSEIASQLHYSSTAHLSSQFKKVTGVTPSEYKKDTIKNRKPIDSI